MARQITLPYLPINLRHKVLRPFIDVDNRVAADFHLVAMLKTIGLVPKDDEYFSKTVNPCIRFGDSYGKSLPQVDTFLCRLYKIKWPEGVILIRLCESSGCHNPWHYQTVAASFDEVAYYKRKKIKDVPGRYLTYAEQKAIIIGEKV